MEWIISNTNIRLSRFHCIRMRRILVMPLGDTSGVNIARNISMFPHNDRCVGIGFLYCTLQPSCRWSHLTCRFLGRWVIIICYQKRSLLMASDKTGYCVWVLDDGHMIVIKTMYRQFYNWFVPIYIYNWFMLHCKHALYYSVASL